MNIKHLFIPVVLPAFFLLSCGGETKEKEDVETVEEAVKATALDNHLLAESKKFFRGELTDYAENEENAYTVTKELLGQALYYDKRLSKDENISCNSCHNLSTFGVDNLSFSPGDAGENGGRNSPTVLNAALHKDQFWDGRAKDVEEQAGMPILNPVEMAIPNEAFLINRLSEIEDYQKMFKRAFPNDENPLTYENLRKAIAVFERTLITKSRFDDYLAGDYGALTIDEKEGMKKYIEVGCTTCHSGVLLGGNMHQKFGVHSDYWEHTKSEKIDEGKFEVTGESYDKHVFKVPSLRNIDETQPYFHDGSVANLSEAVNIMALAQLNVKLSAEDNKSIVAFLKTLTGEVPESAQKIPDMLNK